MAYPTDIPSFTPISGTTLVASDDHANRHNTEGSAITALANTLGTTAGTSIAKNFDAGDFAIRANSGGTLQETVIGGTIKSSTFQLWDGWNKANETWTSTGVDTGGRTGTIVVSSDVTGVYSQGMKVGFAQGGTTMYGFITNSPALASGTTTMTVYTGTAYLMGTTAITINKYSSGKSPLNFPLNPSFWTVQTKDTSNRTQDTPTANTWYNIGTTTIDVPIGIWDIDYQLVGYSEITSGAAVDFLSTLSTSGTAESDSDFTVLMSAQAGTANLVFNVPMKRSKSVSLTSKTTYYMNAKTSLSGLLRIIFNNSSSPLIIKATSSFL